MRFIRGMWMKSLRKYPLFEPEPIIIKPVSELEEVMTP